MMARLSVHAREVGLAGCCLAEQPGRRFSTPWVVSRESAQSEKKKARPRRSTKMIKPAPRVFFFYPWHYSMLTYVLRELLRHYSIDLYS